MPPKKTPKDKSTKTRQRSAEKKKDDDAKDTKDQKRKILKKRCGPPLAIGTVMAQRVLPPTVCCPPRGCPIPGCLRAPGCGWC